MKTIEHFKKLIAQTASASRVPHHQAVALTVKAHPDLAIIYRASGETPARIQFCNARIASKIVSPNLPAERKQFHTSVSAEMQRSGCSYQIAFNRVSAGNARFANSEDLKTVQNAASGSGGVPTLTPALASIFRLPPDVTPDEWRKIWEANGGTATTINYGQCFSAACDLMQSQTGKDIESAIEPAKARFPDLWAATEELAKLSF